MATVAFDRVGSIGILYLGLDHPTNEEWDEYVAFCAAGAEVEEAVLSFELEDVDMEVVKSTVAALRQDLRK